jgi:transmembrane sensor
MDPRKINAQIYEEACEWFVEFRDREPEQSKRREFDRWLRASPEHLSAYLEIAGIWSAAPGLDPEHRWTRDRLVEDAGPARDNVITFLSGVAKDSPVPAPRAKWGARRLAVALGAISFATATLGTLAWLNSNDSYDTVVGEQRSVTLPDGSTVDLNSRSSIEIHYSQRSREISLLEGQALFSVAKDPSRPFIVSSGHSRVRAVGTQFDVNRKAGGTVVTVLEGRVSIIGNSPSNVGGPEAESRGPENASAPQSGSAEVVLAAGGQVVITDASVVKRPNPNVAGAIAWRQRRLVFDSATLVEVAEEFNRYNTRQLVIQDPDLHSFHISGVFSSTDPASLIRFLRERPEVKVIETASEIRVTKNSP